RFNNTIVNGAGTSNAGSSSTNRLRHSVKYRPVLLPGQGITDYDQEYANETNSNSLALVNPILLTDAEFRRNYSTLTNLSGYINLNFTKFLSFRSTVGFDIYDVRQTAFDDTITGNSRLNGSGNPLASIGSSNRLTINNSNVLTYTNAKMEGDFSRRNKLSLLAGHEVYQARIRGENQLSRDFPIGIDARKALANMNLEQTILITHDDHHTKVKITCFL